MLTLGAHMGNKCHSIRLCARMKRENRAKYQNEIGQAPKIRFPLIWHANCEISVEAINSLNYFNWAPAIKYERKKKFENNSKNSG